MSTVYDAGCPISDEQLSVVHDREYASLLQNASDAHAEMLATLPPWAKDDEQDQESWDEQQECAHLLADRIELVARESTRRERIPAVRPLYITGPPGCGKTYMALNALRQLEEATDGMPGTGRNTHSFRICTALSTFPTTTSYFTSNLPYVAW